MDCPSCGRANPEGKKFCGDCGAPLPVRCAACGAENPAGKRFCSDCGAALTASTRASAAAGASAPVALRVAEPLASLPASSPAAERRQLTVMFSDLVGSTALSSRLDPEDLREIIAAYRRCIAKTVAGFDGFVAKYMGDGVLVYFGYPRAHEDDPERAVRAGLALVEAVGQIQAPERLRVRVGIATGLVVVGDLVGSGEAQERGVVGETPNLAARLQALAEPDTIVIAATTRRLIGGLFEYEDLGGVEAKGFAGPVQAWRVRGESAAESRFEALRAAALTPLVGRDEEIELLLRRWTRAKRGDGQVVLLSGEPGIGKSRLVADLQEQIASEIQHTRLRYFCSPYHQDSALHPVIAHLEHAAGFGREDPPETKVEKLKKLLAPASPPAEDVALLAEWLSVPTVAGRRDAPLDSLTPQRKKERTFEALFRQLEGLARLRPVLMVFEDVHWIDPTSLELLDLMVERVRRLPVLLLVTFRPELTPPWVGQAHVATMALARLDRRDGAALVERLIGNRAVPLPSEIVAEIVERADGVPLFVEELTKAVLETTQTSDAAGSSTAIPRPTLAVPATLRALLTERLDRLGSAAKEVAQIGSAIGREFSYELLAAIARPGQNALQQALAGLAEAGLVFQRGAPPEAVYTFKHALVQDATYRTLLKSKRQVLHARIATALEERFPDFVRAGPELLAHHNAEAGALHKAASLWLQAGRNYARRSANIEASRFCERALAAVQALPDTSTNRQLELDIQLAHIPALMAAAGFADARTMAAARRADTLCEEFNAIRQALPVLFAQLSYHTASGNIRAAEQIASRILKLGQTHQDELALFVGYRALGFCHIWLGKLTSAQDELEVALKIAPRIASGGELAFEFGHELVTTARVVYGDVKLQCGWIDEGRRLQNQAQQAAEALEHWFTLTYVLFHRLRTEAMAANYAVVLDLARAFDAMCQQHSIVQWGHPDDFFRWWAVMKLNGTAEELPALLDALRKHRQGAYQMNVPYCLVLAAELCTVAGEFGTAEELISDASAAIERSGEVWVTPHLHRLRASLFAARANSQRAKECLLASLAEARRQKAKFAELLAARDLARSWAERGDRQKALDLLAPVYGWFTEGFDLPDLKEAKALLDELRRS
ncbi:MAG TPA: AAA family ATPase [Acetobacteraceae bacterium]|nr:AAA family ATPase [Acetobacteraceae bacterium]